MDNRFTSLFTRSKDVFFVMDMNGVILHSNPSFQRLFNYNEAELTGINIAEICHPEDKKSREESQGSLLLSKKPVDYQSRIKAKGGGYYNVSWSAILNDDNLIYSTGTPRMNMPVISEPPDNDIVQHTIQNLNEGFIVLDTDWNIIAFNPAFQAMTSLNAEEIKQSGFINIKSLGIIPEVISECQRSLNDNTPVQVQYLNTYLNSWLRINIYPYDNQLALFIRDITEIKIQEWVLGLEKRVLELNAATQHTLAQTTGELLRGIEAIFPDMICSVLEVDDAQQKLYTLAAPRLPKAYSDQLEGLPVGPGVGSCGNAVYHREQTIVSDVENDPLWADYADMIKPFGLKACWSTPVISSNGAKVLAVFGIYYTTVREPDSDELHLIGRTVNILRVLIESKKNEQDIKEQNNRLQSIAAISSHELRRPVATILGLVNLFDKYNTSNPLNSEIIDYLYITTKELDKVIHDIIEKTLYVKASEKQIS